MLEEFKEEMGGSDGRYVGSEAKRVIEPGTQPKSHKPYRVPDSIRDKVKEAVEQLVTDGRVEETESAWGAHPQTRRVLENLHGLPQSKCGNSTAAVPNSYAR